MNAPSEKTVRRASEQKNTVIFPSVKDETPTKIEEENSISEGDTYFHKTLEETHFNFDNVRFTPKIIEFDNAFEGKQFAVDVSIQNIGRNPVLVKIGEPNSFIFQVKKPTRRTKFLAAGSRITKTITYTYHNVDLVQKSILPVIINGNQVDYPIIVKKAMPDIQIKPHKLDFEVINLGASAKTLVLTIYNNGSRRTKFKIDVGKNVLDLVVNPLEGTVKAKSYVKVMVELMGFKEGEFYHELWIKTSEMPIRVPVLVEVVRPKLEIVYPDGTEDFTLINFKPTFNGTQKVRTFVLRNCSADSTLYNTFAEVNGEVQFLKRARSTIDEYTVFKLTHEEGQLEPFEKIVVTALFQPRSFTRNLSWIQVDPDLKREHIVFLRINGAHCDERKELTDEEGHTITSGKSDHASEGHVHSITSLKTPTPSGKDNRIHEQDGENAEGAGKLSSYFIPPEEKILRLCLHGSAVEPDILLEPDSYEFGELFVGEIKKKVLRITNNSILPVMCKICKTVNVDVIPQTKWIKSKQIMEFLLTLQPRFAGIFQRKMTVEIIAHSDVVFKSDEPLKVIAMHTVAITYHAKDVSSVSGKRNQLELISQETKKLKVTDALIPFIKDLVFIYNKNSTPKEECVSPEDNMEKLFKKIFDVKPFKFDPLKCKKHLQGREHNAIYEFVPLSSVLLSNIKVEPKMINFNKVAIHTTAQETVTFKNMNNFPISIKFKPGKSSVSVTEKEAIKIQPLSTKSIHVFFQAKDLGRYFGFLNYVINGTHEFKITISVFVAPKNLNLEGTNTTVSFGKYDIKEAFQPRSRFLCIENVLQYPVKYRWNISRDSAFFTDILEGEVPPRTSFLAEIICKLSPAKAFYAEMVLIAESGSTEQLKVIHPTKKINVRFLANQLHLNDVPLNILTKIRPVIQNASYHDVVFEVLTSSPAPGVTVEPKQGIIKARSFFLLEVNILIPVIVSFSFDLDVLVHFIHRISVKISGNVVLPTITIKPSEIVLRKICAQSFDVVTICVENAGTTPAEIAIDFKNCPEFQVVDKRDRIYLTPKQSSIFSFLFEPNEATRYIFYLPVIINNILGPPEMQESSTEFVSHFISKYEGLYQNFGDVVNTENLNFKLPCVSINTTVSQSVLSISPMNVNFKLKCGFQSVQNECPHSPDYKFQTEFQSQKINFYNDFNEEVTFCYRNDDIGDENGSPFNLIPITTDSIEQRYKSVKVHLKKGKKFSLKATFTPRKAGFYSVKVPIFVKGYSNGLVYNYLKLRGEFKIPRIRPEASEIHFPPLPLDVSCDVIVMIYAENYITSDSLQCLVYETNKGVEEFISPSMTTKWVKEPVTNPGQQLNTFQLQISFQSHVPVSLRNYILIIDSEGHYSSIFITAVADNSVISTHAFLSTKTFKYKIVKGCPLPRLKTEEFVFSYPINKFELKAREKAVKEKKSKSAVGFTAENVEGKPDAPRRSNADEERVVDKGPRLFLLEIKLSNRPVQSGYENTAKVLVDHTRSSSVFFTVGKTKTTLMNSSNSESMGSRKPSTPFTKRTEWFAEVTYPNFPSQDNIYYKHFHETRMYIERWIYEVVMRCEQYYSIPKSFQHLKQFEAFRKEPENVAENRGKDFLCLLQEILGPSLQIPKSISFAKIIYVNEAFGMQAMFSDLLRFLESHGCLLPHVKPEYLMEYDYYVMYMKNFKMNEKFSWKNNEIEKINSMKILQELYGKTKSDKETNKHSLSSLLSVKESWRKSLFEGFRSDMHLDRDEIKPGSLESRLLKQQFENITDQVLGKEYEHPVDELDQADFELRSTQAWFDILLQVFKVFVLKNIVQRNTIPTISVLEKTDKITQQSIDLHSIFHYNKKNRGPFLLPAVYNLSSNVYSVQEQILLDWMNYHLKIQHKLLWRSSEEERLCATKFVNNFDKDLSDSVALIAVTASHCPYIVADYFYDVFLKPNTPNKAYHNAARLIQVWRMLSIGLTVEAADIVKPNPVFMLMLVTQLYRILPTLHPHSLICFLTPLNTEITRTIPLRNDHLQKILYNVLFFGEYEGFSLKGPNVIEVKPSGVTEISIRFVAKKIKRVSATLVLTGCVVSPEFGNHLAFYLEGEPSELTTSAVYTMSAPLYKVVCSQVKIRPPYNEPATYEIWYTTQPPKYKKQSNIHSIAKPWSEIWDKKISRRLFLSKNEITVGEEKEAILKVTLTCLTTKTRMFWLLFRSDVGDFIVLFETHPEVSESVAQVSESFCTTLPPRINCFCLTRTHLNKPKDNSCTCKYQIVLKLPTRNDALWNALWAMFKKTLQPREKAFWAEHFETDIGLCLILWLLHPNEEEEIVNEFVPGISTCVAYKLRVEPPESQYVTLPPKIEIPDVRKNTEVVVPIEVLYEAPKKLCLKMTLTSLNDMEIRNLKINMNIDKRG